MGEKILVVDDEKEIADLVELYLKNEGFAVCKFYNGTEALECVDREEISLAILDVMLPDMDGFTICRKIREKYFFPVIMLTAKVESQDKITGLTLGADDYVTKPFHPLDLPGDSRVHLKRSGDRADAHRVWHPLVSVLPSGQGSPLRGALRAGVGRKVPGF